MPVISLESLRRNTRRRSPCSTVQDDRSKECLRERPVRDIGKGFHG
jgi:hypothetical protein